MNEKEIREIYKEDTKGRAYHKPIITKQPCRIDAPASDVLTYNIYKAMTYAEFINLSRDMKITYIKHLRKTYNANGMQMAEMLGISSASFYQSVIKPLELTGFLKYGKRKQTKEQAQKWLYFLAGAVDNTPVAVEVKPPEETIINNDTAAAKGFNITYCNFTQTGSLNIADITKRISAMVEEGTHCKISIIIEGITEKAACGFSTEVQQ